jgi:hypothetical protein
MDINNVLDPAEPEKAPALGLDPDATVIADGDASENTQPIAGNGFKHCWLMTISKTKQVMKQAERNSQVPLCLLQLKQQHRASFKA